MSHLTSDLYLLAFVNYHLATWIFSQRAEAEKALYPKDQPMIRYVDGLGADVDMKFTG